MIDTDRTPVWKLSGQKKNKLEIRENAMTYGNIVVDNFALFKADEKSEVIHTLNHK